MHQKDNYRNITGPEIEVLKNNNCICDTWNRIFVKEGFDPSRFNNVIFSGDIYLGVFNESIINESGVTFQSGVSNARLHNCTIGSNVVIINIGDFVANYEIGDNVILKNCGKVHTEGVSSFGNGKSVAVINETGGRAVKMWDRLSSHEAYIVALYRHRIDAVNVIEKLVDDYSAKHSSDIGTIGHNSRIINCNTIRNVKFGPHCHVDGALKLNEGSVNSCEEDPVFIGSGVVMEHFIVCSGSIITDSSMIDKCFVGQGSILAKQFSAENSMFFANCVGYHGEACSILAGPYTVTHHKSTLLIAGIFSFMNAGSGSNQSNHMYKLGPVHQGIMERGSKTSSNSYLMWPSRIGLFTLIMGRHYKNIDSSSLPFSYLIEANEESVIVPGINLRNIGTIRDAQKWPGRDRRKDSLKIDQINFNLLNPYSISKMIEGRDLLLKLKIGHPNNESSYAYNNLKINSVALERGIYLYQTGINKYIGNLIIMKLGNREVKTPEELRSCLDPGQTLGSGDWVDLAGLIAPEEAMNKLLDDIESGVINSVERLSDSFVNMQESSLRWEWTWVCNLLEKETGLTVNKITAGDVITIVERWKKSVIELDNLIYEDAKKEFTVASMTGFGIDGSDDTRNNDFHQVRGEFESNSIVASIKDHIAQKQDIGDELIDRLKKII